MIKSANALALEMCKKVLVRLLDEQSSVFLQVAAVEVDLVDMVVLGRKYQAEFARTFSFASGRLKIGDWHAQWLVLSEGMILVVVN